MKKTVLLLTWVLVGYGVGVAAPVSAADKVANTKIVQATQDTTLTYADLSVFIPQGQTVILGSTAQGKVVLRGQNLNGVKIGDGTVNARGPVVLAVDPKTQVIQVMRGSEVKVSDKKGRTAELSSGASVSVKNIRQNVQPTLPVQTISIVEAEEIMANNLKGLKVEGDLNQDIASFVVAAEVSAAALEQKGYKAKKKKKRKK